MSVVKWVRKTSRLAAMIDQPGGITVGRTMERVTANVNLMRPEGQQIIDEALTKLESLTAAHSADEVTWLTEIYTSSAQVLDIAGPFGFDALGKAAFSLCDLADRFGNAGGTELAYLQVHVRAMRLLFANPSLGEEGGREVLNGLDRVLGRVPRE